jgi:hypothetical protein
MLIWIGIAIAWVADLAVMAVLAARAPIMAKTRVWRNGSALHLIARKTRMG